MSKDITLVIVDNQTHDLARFSIEKTLKTIDCRDVLVFSDRDIIQGAKTIYLDGAINLYDYSEIILKKLAEHINTDRVLVIQWDGMAVNPTLWNDNFLNYDYIGAIWPWRIQGQQMGNGGFSLRSRKLLDACQDQLIKLGGISEVNEDIAICVEHRSLLEQQYGIRYAPLNVARQFSTENEWLGRTFGFHGLWNAPRFLSRSEIEFVIEHIPDYWTDLDKVQQLINVLVEQDYEDLAHRVYDNYS